MRTAGRPATAPGPRPGKAATDLFVKKEFNRENALGADGQSLTVPSCLPPQHTCSFMLNYNHQVYDPAGRFPADLR